MPGDARYESPTHSDPTKNVSYRGFKYNQVIKANNFRCTTPATAFAPNNEGALCPASQTAVYLYIGIDNLKVGDRIVGFNLLGYGTSAGNAYTVDAGLMKVPKAGTPADPTGDASNVITQVSKTANYTMDEQKIFSAPYTVVDDEQYHIYVLVTTAAVTTVQVTGAEVITDRK